MDARELLRLVDHFAIDRIGERTAGEAAAVTIAAGKGGCQRIRHGLRFPKCNRQPGAFVCLMVEKKGHLRL